MPLKDRTASSVQSSAADPGTQPLRTGVKCRSLFLGRVALEVAAPCGEAFVDAGPAETCADRLFVRDGLGPRRLFVVAVNTVAATVEFDTAASRAALDGSRFRSLIGLSLGCVSTRHTHCGASGLRASDAREHAVERSRNAVQLDRLSEDARVADVATTRAAQEAS